MSTRKMVLASWHGARQRADVNGAVTLTPSSFAGYAIEACDGDVAAARRLIPVEPEVFWARVLDALEQVVVEEAPVRLVAGGQTS